MSVQLHIEGRHTIVQRKAVKSQRFGIDNVLPHVVIVYFPDHVVGNTVRRQKQQVRSLEHNYIGFAVAWREMTPQAPRPARRLTTTAEVKCIAIMSVRMEMQTSD
jgi:hypothetical protein